MPLYAWSQQNSDASLCLNMASKREQCLTASATWAGGWSASGKEKSPKSAVMRQTIKSSSLAVQMQAAR